MYSVHISKRKNNFGFYEVCIHKGESRKLTLQQAQQVKARVEASQSKRSLLGLPQLSHWTLVLFTANLVEEETKAEVA